MNRFLRTVRGNRGVTIIEFALVLPMLLVLIISVVDFGLYFFVQHSLQFATREGVRLALVGRTLTDQSGNQLNREASIIKKINDCASIAVNPSQLQISIYPVNPDYSDPTDWATSQNAGSPGSYMRVKTRYYYKFITPMVSVLVPNGKILVQSQATYRNEFF